ncbi:MAG: biotin--[acetyl-CoA-carboxylase] ligase [Flavobacteriales bacterium]|jgi:BirA family biotin operon repressor/biotin-[acetyl-CoA-carboxylase] ligase|nr:biotin--[acetyl-CoA-carboxylase] ligase [Flavobacteriales bacterium]
MLVFGHTIEELEVIDSTNSYLIQKSKEQRVYEGEVVLAHYQTQGRGQRASVWESLPGENLMCSIFALPTFLNGDNFFLISKAIALAVKAVVSSKCPNDLVEVKWPNDIYVNQKKIGGILIENQYKGNQIKQAVIGVGLNINQVFFENDRATSLKLLTHKDYSVKTILKELLQAFEKYYFELKWGNNTVVEEGYLEGLMNYKVEKSYKVGDQRIKGVIQKVENNGTLVLASKGEVLTFQFKEISYIF